MADHHDDIPSTSSRPSASFSRTPLASVTSSEGTFAGIGAYGCHTCWASRASRPAESIRRP
ncbi:hypothetical protein [Amycolatopsis balhimycina]|uniref:hypothetical protein n=1 Tax=Amycolatopsis balhimycina TaxID=208443 RepID=UPI00037240E3|nr:hypothetical protein [Amycolatopsis balhimycina]